jgi:hypothetical protein
MSHQSVRSEVRKPEITLMAASAVLMPVQLSLFAAHLLDQHIV